MRVFAGSNGSGKSTIIKEIRKFVTTGSYINADDIEKSFRERGFVNLADLQNIILFLDALYKSQLHKIKATVIYNFF